MCEPEIVNISVEFEDICSKTEGREPIVDNFSLDRKFITSDFFKGIIFITDDNS